LYLWKLQFTGQSATLLILIIKLFDGFGEVFFKKIFLSTLRKKTKKYFFGRKNLIY